MSQKLIAQLSLTFLAGLLLTFKTSGQQIAPALPSNALPEQVAKFAARNTYTYKLFIAPNKVFGYDIFRDGKIIFHQAALAEPAGDKSVSINRQFLADKAATLAIEKIKKGLPPELTRQDIIEITAH